jgi:hypothetical protein
MEFIMSTRLCDQGLISGMGRVVKNFHSDL